MNKVGFVMAIVFSAQPFDSPKGPVSLRRVMLMTAKRGAMGPVSKVDVETLIRTAIESVKHTRTESATCVLKWIDSLEAFLICLEDSTCSEQEVLRVWDALPKSLQTILERFDRRKPREVLSQVNAKGLNQLEQLLECLYAAHELTSDEEDLLQRMRGEMAGGFESLVHGIYLNGIFTREFMEWCVCELSREQICKIPDERLRVAIVKHIIRESKGGLMPFRRGIEPIQDYSISEQDRIEIALLMAEQSASSGLFRIENYGITNQDALVKIAKVVARQGRGRISEFIMNYKITSEQALGEIALLASDYDSLRVSLYIKNYQITDQKVLAEIAMAAAKRDPTSVSQYIKNYQITDQKLLVEIAMAAAQSRSTSYGMSEHIRNYGIEDEKILIEIAKVVAQMGSPISEFIMNYKITSEQARGEIALLAAKRDPFDVCRHMECYRLRDERVCIEIAMLAARRDGYRFCECIKYCKILNEDALLDIARILSRRNADCLKRYIMNANIKNEKIRIEIAMLAAQHSASETYRDILEYRIEDEEGLTTVRAVCLLTLMTKLPIESLAPNLADLRGALVGKWTHKEKGGIVRSLLKIENDEKYAEFCQSFKDPNNLRALVPLLYLTWFEGIITRYPSSGEVIREILDLRDPQLKWVCSVALVHFSPFESAFAHYGKLTHKKAYLRLPLLFLNLWGTQEVSKSWLGKKSVLCDGRKIVVLLSALSSLDRNLELSDQDKLSLISAYDAHDYLSGLRLLDVLCGMGCVNKGFLKDCIIDGELSIETLHRKFTELTQQIFMLSITPEQYDQHFNTVIPHAVATYAVKIKGIPEVQWALTQCMKWELAGQFKKQRYVPESSAHLKELQRKHPEVLVAWQESLEAAQVAEMDGGKIVLSFPEFCYTKLITDQHWPEVEKECPSFFRWLLDQKSPIPKEFGSELEKTLFELSSGALSKPATIGKLEELRKVLALQAEFVNDINAYLQQFEDSKTTQPMEVVCVDDFMSLFLCGSVVPGSCQRVDGNPSINKCLLGYVMDGKNRMLVVRSVETGKVEARCIFRLLFNEMMEPVLFADRIYPDACNRAYVQALRDHALAEARRMKLPLYTADDQPKGRTASLKSLGSKAAFEYEDAAGGVTNGVFNIVGAHLVVP